MQVSIFLSLWPALDDLLSAVFKKAVCRALGLALGNKMWTTLVTSWHRCWPSLQHCNATHVTPSDILRLQVPRCTCSQIPPCVVPRVLCYAGSCCAGHFMCQGTQTWWT